MSDSWTKQMIMGHFPATTEHRRAFYIWLGYYSETEAFDRTICRRQHPETGTAIPLGSWERRAVNKYAVERRREAEWALRGIGREVSEQARRAALRRHETETR